MTNIIYSFIIPHKNTPELLNRCLGSIPMREDLEIIVIDDNSDDGQIPVKNREDLTVVLLNANESNGAGRARNIGLKHAKGKWLLFADADDYYTDFLPVLLDKYANDEKTDIVYLNAQIVNDEFEFIPLPISKIINNYKSCKNYSEELLKYNFWTPWSRMIKREIVNKWDIIFDEVPAGNDINFCLECSLRANIFAVEDQILYHYYCPKSISQTNRKRTSAIVDDMLKVRSRTIAIYNQANYRYIPSYIEYFIHSPYSTDLSISIRIKKYYSVLRRYKAGVFTDIKRYLTCLLAKKKNII